MQWGFFTFHKNGELASVFYQTHFRDLHFNPKDGVIQSAIDINKMQIRSSTK